MCKLTSKYIYSVSRPPTEDALEISSQFEELLNEQFMTSKIKKMLETLAKHSKDDKVIIFVGGM